MDGRLTWMCLAWPALLAMGSRAASAVEVLIVKAADIICG